MQHQLLKCFDMDNKMTNEDLDEFNQGFSKLEMLDSLMEMCQQNQS